MENLEQGLRLIPYLEDIYYIKQVKQYKKVIEWIHEKIGILTRKSTGKQMGIWTLTIMFTKSHLFFYLIFWPNFKLESF